MTETATESVESAVVLAALEAQVTDADREAEAEVREKERLELRWRELAPEALQGSEEAIAAQREVEAELLEIERKAKLRRFAQLEIAARAKAAEDAASAEQRDRWRAEKETAERARDAAFSKFERAITSALDAAKEGIEANATAEALAKSLGEQRGPDCRMLVENRLMRRVHEELGVYGIKPGIVIGNEGRAPLAVEAPSCAVCEHEHRDAMESDRAEGASLRVLADKFAVGRTTLSEHFRDHAEA